MNFLKVLLAQIFTLVIFISYNVSGQLVVTPGRTAAILASKLAGPGITITSPILTCGGTANGTFISTATPLTIDSGILLCTGSAVQAAGLETFLASSNIGTTGDPTLATLAMATTYDACALEFDFVPIGDTVKFNYQFGSEEYNHSTCGPYNDAFAFFISGPGIVGTVNMALIPGTTIPVTVNSVNSGTPGTGLTLANCTAMGPGSPFTSYFYDNTGGTQLTYKGYTVKMKAIHDVIPCNTYHLKMAICDAGNRIYDSGVFIEAGSLSTNSYHFEHLDSIGHTINGVAHTIVKGCSPATIKVRSAVVSGTNKTVHFTFGGAGIHNVDFSSPDSATIVAGSDSVLINVSGIPTPPGGTKTITIYLISPLSCGVADSISLNIMDTPSVRILTSDTAICPGQTFQIRVSGTTGLTYVWAPGATLSSTTIMQPIALPTGPVTYTVTATLPNSGCPAIIRTLNVILASLAINILTPADTLCIGSSFHIRVSGGTGATFVWSPSAGLDHNTVPDPIATPATSTVYTVTVSSTSGCVTTGTVSVTVINPVPNILTNDTFLCIGNSVVLNATTDPGVGLIWSPSSNLSDPTINNPVATPTVTTTYTLTETASSPHGNCIANTEVTVTVFPKLYVVPCADQSICLNSTIKLSTEPSGADYIYNWTGPNGFTSTVMDPLINHAQGGNQGTYSVTVTNASGCSGDSSTNVTVFFSSVSLTNVTLSQTIPFGSSIQLNADNAIKYMWTPADGSLNNPNINNPIATPQIPTTYTVYGMDNHGCTDSAKVTINLTHTGDIFIPSAFTPNGDGLNDIFRVGNLGLNRLVEMSIYNRWGDKVYHSVNGESNGWDGAFGGVMQDVGVYNYVIVIGRPDMPDDVYKGNLTLIR